MRRSSDGGVFTETTVAITVGAADLFIGSADCNACFVRLEANGIVEDGPSTDFMGDWRSVHARHSDLGRLAKGG
jgi:hypothetical protein